MFSIGSSPNLRRTIQEQLTLPTVSVKQAPTFFCFTLGANWHISRGSRILQLFSSSAIKLS